MSIEENNLYQNCPICNGSGVVPNSLSTTAAFVQCPTCFGQRIIAKPSSYWKTRCELAEAVLNKYGWFPHRPSRVMKLEGYDEALKKYNDFKQQNKKQ